MKELAVIFAYRGACALRYARMRRTSAEVE